MDTDLGELTITSSAAGDKLESNAAWDVHGAGVGKTAVIVKVAREDYVPAGVEVRARIGPQIFTADVDETDVARLQEDADVVSVGTPRAVHEAGG